MEVSFSKNPENPATPVVEVAVTTTPTPVPGVTVESTTTAAPAAPVSQVPAVIPSGVPVKHNTLLLGDKLPNFDEMILPRVNLVQNIGQLSESYEPGTLLYNQQTPLFIPARINEKAKTIDRPGTPPVTMTFVGFRPTRYVEKVIGGGKGLIVDTEDAVRAAGGTLDYTEWKLKEKSGIKRFEPLADGLVVIERPEIVVNDGTTFVYDIEGKQYAIALWAVRGTAYTNLCKRVLFPARRMGALKQGGFPSWNYSLSSREESYSGGNKAWVPVALAKAKNTPAMLAFITDLVNEG